MVFERLLCRQLEISVSLYVDDIIGIILAEQAEDDRRVIVRGNDKERGIQLRGKGFNAC